MSFLMLILRFKVGFIDERTLSRRFLETVFSHSVIASQTASQPFIPNYFHDKKDFFSRK